jgi:aminocarboxymuconate-semialdehyde decarboxylase
MHGWKSMPELSSKVESPAEQARRLYYDTLVYDRGALAFLIETFGMTQLCLGTDHPFSIQELDPVGGVDSLALTTESRELLLSKNAMRFLGLEPGRPRPSTSSSGSELRAR